MEKQMIISIGREYGANGHYIADKLAEKYNIPVYDSHMIEYIAKEKNLDLNELKKYDEKTKNRLFTRTLDGHSSSPEDVIANMQFDFLREKAAEGQSFVVVGRCGNSVLKDNPNLISIFITGDMDVKAKRISALFDVTIKEAEAMIIKNNKKRKQYHNLYSKEKWGDSRYYELTVNTSKIGVEKAFEIVDAYVLSRIS